MEQATLLVSLFGVGSAVGGIGGGLVGQVAYTKVCMCVYVGLVSQLDGVCAPNAHACRKPLSRPSLT